MDFGMELGRSKREWRDENAFGMRASRDGGYEDVFPAFSRPLFYGKERFSLSSPRSEEVPMRFVMK